MNIFVSSSANCGRAALLYSTVLGTVGIALAKGSSDGKARRER